MLWKNLNVKAWLPLKRKEKRKTNLKGSQEQRQQAQWNFSLKNFFFSINPIVQVKSTLMVTQTLKPYFPMQVSLYHSPMILALEKKALCYPYCTFNLDY